jgi:hypothetical protein
MITIYVRLPVGQEVSGQYTDVHPHILLEGPIFPTQRMDVRVTLVDAKELVDV